MRGSLLLKRDLDVPFPAPQWPEGIAVAPFRDADAAACHALLRRAYDGQGTTPLSPLKNGGARRAATPRSIRTSCSWPERRTDPSLVSPFCWTSIFVKGVVVDPDYRRRGIGEALLLTAFATLQRRDHSRIGLKLRSGNRDGVRRRYDRLGFVLG